MEFHFRTYKLNRYRVPSKTVLMGLLLVGMALSVALGQNQIRITTNVLPPYSPYIQDYSGVGNRVQVFVGNLSGKALSVRLLGKLEGDNGVVIRTSPNYRPLRPLKLLPTDVNRLLTRSELEGLFDLNQIEVQGMDKNLLYRGLPLPEGNYQLCVQAFDNATIRPLSAEFPLGCSGLIPVRIIEPPILISPFEGEEVLARTPQTQTFTWSAPVGILPNQVEYSLKIVELPNAEANPNVFLDAVVLPKSGVEIKNLRTNTFLYGPQYPPLQYGKKYAWRVQAHAISQKLNLLNDGKSPVQSFQYGVTLAPGLELVQVPVIPGLLQPIVPETKLLSANPPANCACKIAVNENDKIDNSYALKAGKATIAGFTVDFLAGVREEKGVLVGMGTIPVPLINNGYVKLRVKLIDVQCNASGQVIGGAVKALYKDKVAGYTPNMDQPTAPAVQLTPAQIQNLGSYFSSTKDQLVSNLKNSANSIGFELPLGIDKTIGTVQTVIAITDVTFTPNQAFFNANTWIKTPSEQVNGIPLSGYNLCLSPTKPCGEGILYLADKVKLSEYFSLKGNDGFATGGFFTPDTAQVTYVVFDQSGYKKMRVHGLLTPPGLKDAATNGPVEISVNTDLEKDFSDWTAQLSFPKFYVEGLDEFRFSMDAGKPALYDHSEVSTPGKLPDGYETAEGLAAWKGIYFPEMTIELPSFLKKSGDQAVTAIVHDLIYDDKGLSGAVEVQDILPINEGSMDGWYYSVDRFAVAFDKSSFQTSSMTGRLVLPVFSDPTSQASQLHYESTLTKNATDGKLEFHLNATPSDGMQSDVWKATLNLTGSSITADYTAATGFSAKASLNGSLDIGTGPIVMEGAKFTGLVLSSKAPYFSLENFTMGLNSPPKEMGGLPFNLTSAKIEQGTGDKSAFVFAGNIDLSEGAGIKASGGIRLAFSTGKNNGRPAWKYEGIEGANLAAEGGVGAIRVKGSIALFADDPAYGNGFRGDLAMQMLDNFDIKVGAMFGKTTGSGGFKYWYIGGKAELPDGATIPLAGPVVFKGFGGGLFSNVSQTLGNDRTVLYTPKKGNRGFNASVLVGMTVPDLLDAEGTFSMSFDGTTLSDINLHADAWFLGTGTPSALATGLLDLNLDLANSKLTGNANLQAGMNLGVGSITATLPTHLEVDYSANPNWYFAIGAPTPDGRTMLSVKFGLSFDFGSYFVMGSYAPNGWKLPPAPYGFDGELLSLFNRVKGSRRDEAGGALKSNTTNPYLAFGAGYKIEYDYNIGPFYMHLNGAVGYDLALKKVDAPCVAGGTLPGIYGWYAEGQLYAGMAFALGIDVDVWLYSGRIEVAKLSAGAILRGGLVNPIWFNGQVAVRYSVLRGLVKGNFNFDFWYNREQRCDPAFLPPNPFADLPLISSIGPAGIDVKTSVISPFTATFNYPVENRLVVEIEVPEGKEMDQSAIGTRVGNTFVQEFKLQFKEEFLAVPAKGGKDSNKGTLVLGKNSEGDRNYAASYYRDNALLPNTEYDLTVGIQVFVYNQNTLQPFLFKNQTVEQTEKVRFVTDNCPTQLSKGTSDRDVVLTSYPYEGQRYFMRGEAAQPFMKLKTNFQGCLSGMGASDQYDLKVALTPLEGNQFASEGSKTVLLAEAEFVGDQYRYTMPPGLKNNALYRLQLLRIPRETYLNEVLAKGVPGQGNVKKITSANIYKSAGSVPAPGSPKNIYGVQDITAKNVDTKYQNLLNTYADEQKLNDIAKSAGLTASIDPTSGKQPGNAVDLRPVENLNKASDLLMQKEKLRKTLRVELYRYYFKTSKYNTLKEKIGAATFATSTEAAKILILGDVVKGSMTTDEGFDRFDLNYENLGYGQQRPPLVLLKATENSNWFKSVAKPIAELLDQAPEEYFRTGNGKYQNNSALLDQTLDGFKRSLVQFSTYLNATEEPYENTEIYRLFPTELHQ